MKHILFTLFSLPTRSERWRFALLAFLLTVSAGLEMVGVGLIIPLIRLMNDPAPFLQVPAVARVNQAFGLTAPGQLVILAGIFFLLVILLKSGWGLMALRYQGRLIARITSGVTISLFRHYMMRPYEDSVQNHSVRAIANCENGIANMLPQVLTAAALLFAEGIVGTGILAVMVTIEPQVSLLSGAMTGGLLWLLYRLTRRRADRLGKQLHVATMDRQRLLQQGLGSLKDVKVLGREEFMTSTFAGRARHTSRVYADMVAIMTMPRLAVEGLMVSAIVMVVIGVQLLQRDSSDVTPVLGMFAFGVFRMMPSANRVLGSMTTLRSARESIERIHDDLALARAGQDSGTDSLPPDIPWPVPRQEIVIDHVSFCYQGSERQILDQACCTIAIGQSVGIVGPSGAGKSTLIDILLGLLSPTSGRILVDGRDIRENLRGWQRHLGYVPQTISLSDDSLRRNIAFGLPDSEIDEQRLAEVIGMARLEDFVASQPQGLDTVVGERGVKLSGGQRQRIGIARALYHGPEILVTDEATSALDNQTERDVIEAIASLRGRKTILIIAHRLSTVRHCDVILFMKNGQVAGSGTFEQLLQTNSEFREMVSLGNTGDLP